MYEADSKSSGDDCTIKVWKLNGWLLLTLEGHTSSVDCLTFNDYIIVSGSTKDCTGSSLDQMLFILFLVRVWDTHTGKVVHGRNLQGYPAYDMVLVEDKLATPHETYFTVWNPYDFYVYQGFLTASTRVDSVAVVGSRKLTGPIGLYKLAFNGSIVVTAHSNILQVRVWDFTSKFKSKAFSGSFFLIRSTQFQDIHPLSFVLATQYALVDWLHSPAIDTIDEKCHS